MLIILRTNLWGNQFCDTGFQLKTAMPIGNLNSSSSKTNRMIAIKVSSLEANGHAVSAPKVKL